MGVVANIAVSLVARTSKLRKGLRAAMKSVARFAKSAAGLGAKIAGIGAALAGVGFGVILKNAFGDVDRLAKLEKVTGINSQSLQVFQVAAERGGTSLEGIAKSARNVARLGFDAVVTKSLEAVRVFKILGITQADLKKGMKNNEFLLALSAQRYNEMADGALKSAVGLKLVGGRNLEVLQSLSGGPAAFAAIRKELGDFGLLLTGNKANVEAVNDTFDDLWRIVKGVAQQFAIALAPTLLAGLLLAKDAFKSFLNEQGGTEAFAKKGLALLIQGFNKLLDVIIWVQQAFAGTKAFMIDLSKNPLVKLLLGNTGAGGRKSLGFSGEVLNAQAHIGAGAIEILGGIWTTLKDKNFGYG